MATAPVEESARSDAIIDCPLRDAPYSVASPLLDLLMNDQARAVVERTLGGNMAQMPAIFLNTEVPSFAAIIDLRKAAQFAGSGEAGLAQADADLRAIPVTDADRAARCARYDAARPDFDLSGDQPKILLFEKINGYRDTPSVNAAHAQFVSLAEANGWQVFATDRGGAIAPDILSEMDLVIWNNISGDVLTVSQRTALREYIEGGGGFLAVHGSAGDPVYFWDWYPDTLIGARFQGHPRDPQFQPARVVLQDPSHPAARRVPAEWTMTDEWYSFRTNPRASGSRIILTLDESTYDPDAGLPVSQRMGGDHPIAWSRRVGEGRVFYSAIGHIPETYSHPVYAAMLEDAMRWTGGIDPD